ncbi:MAG: glycosyl hydrolase family 28 protein [Verrucomicrobiota bacterium]|jgi:hypothetical protein
MNTRAAFGLAVCAFAGLAHAGTPALPNIPAYTTNVTQAPYNAVGDGITTNTTAIQKAINDVNARGGGTVEIPATPAPGVYLTGPLTMTNKINLQIDAGATLRMLPYATWYPTWTTTPLLSLTSLNNIEISGGGGIDGQGADWWSNKPGCGLYMISFNNCNTVLVQNATFSNAPAQQIVFKGKNGNITLQGVTIQAPSSHATTPSHNTDGIDLVGTNCLVQNCTISTGDDNIAIGSSSSGAIASDILVTNCAFGDGHGISIGSNTAGGVSNLTVINCTFNGTDNGIRMKSDNATSSPGAGGVAQNLAYYNLNMTNIRYEPILIYSYYNEIGTPVGVSPSTAATQTVDSVTANTPIWRNIVISNLTATVASGGQAGLIWGRIEMPATNIILRKINITAPANFDLYNANAIQFVDSQITLSSGNTFSLYNAQVTISNSAPSANPVTLDGLTTNGFGNGLALYNAPASLSNTNALGNALVTLSGSTLTVSNNLQLTASSVVNFALGTNAAKLVVSSNLLASGTINITAGAGFTDESYTLFTYGRGLTWGPPALGSLPAGCTYAFNTNTAGQVNLLVSSTNPSSPPAITNQPTSRTVLAGSNALFAVGASGSPPLSYQWWFNTTNSVAGGTNASLTVSNAQPADAGGYLVIVTNAGGGATSAVAVLTVSVPPTFGDIRVATGGGSLVISGSGGTPDGIYYVLTSTNVAVPANQWTCVATNQFDGASHFVFTNTPDTNFPQSFYLLQLP